jgi:hypothetical protein
VHGAQAPNALAVAMLLKSLPIVVAARLRAGDTATASAATASTMSTRLSQPRDALDRQDTTVIDRPGAAALRSEGPSRDCAISPAGEARVNRMKHRRRAKVARGSGR